MESMKDRVCSKCYNLWPLTNIYFPHRNNGRWFEGRCRACCAEANKLYRQKLKTNV